MTGKTKKGWFGLWTHFCLVYADVLIRNVKHTLHPHPTFCSCITVLWQNSSQTTSLSFWFVALTVAATQHLCIMVDVVHCHCRSVVIATMKTFWKPLFPLVEGECVIIWSIALLLDHNRCLYLLLPSHLFVYFQHCSCLLFIWSCITAIFRFVIQILMLLSAAFQGHSLNPYKWIAWDNNIHSLSASCSDIIAHHSVLDWWKSSFHPIGAILSLLFWRLFKRTVQWGLRFIANFTTWCMRRRM